MMPLIFSEFCTIKAGRIAGAIGGNMLAYYLLQDAFHQMKETIKTEYILPMVVMHINASYLGYALGPILPAFTVPYALYHYATLQRDQKDEDLRQKQEQLR